MSLTVEIIDDCAVVRVGSEVERKDFAPVMDAIAPIEKLSAVRIDLKNLFHIKSEILAQLLIIKKTANSKKAQTYLLNVSESVYQVLEISNLLQFFIIEQDFSSYTVSELIDMFHRTEYAESVSDYMALNYTDEYRDALIGCADSDDSIVREYCILTVGRAQDSSALDIIRKALDSNYPNIIAAAVLVLGWLGDSESKERFYGFLTSPYPEVAEAAGATIALVSSDDDAARLEKLAETGNNELRTLVSGVLALINGDEAYRIMKDMFAREQDENVRKSLIRRLALFNKPEVTEILIALLDDKSMAIQEVAAAGLERTGLRGHEDKVLLKITDDDSWLSYFAVKALGGHCSAKCVDHLIKIYPNMEENVRLAIVEALGSTPEDTHEFLLERLKDKNEDIRKESLSALYKTHKDTAVAEAVKLAGEDASWLVRYKAVEIIIKEKPAGYMDVLSSIKDKDDNRYIQEKITSVLGA